MEWGGRRELCRVLTGDHLHLEGLLNEPEVSSGDFPVSAVMLVHGTGDSFYSGGVLEEFSRMVVERGIAVLRINTRGHDVVTRIAVRDRSVWGGAAYETISDCRQDLAAWIGFLKERGHRQIGLVGHSMGAVKAIYAQGHDWHEEVRCVVGISPPRFCHQRLISHPLAQPFREDFHRAEKLVSQGQGDQLLSVRQPLPLLLTAAGFLAKYGPTDEYDFLKPLPKLGCPGLILLGSESVRTSPAFAGVPEDVVQLITEQPNLPLAFELIDGANTGYSTCLGEPFRRSERWLESLAKSDR